MVGNTSSKDFPLSHPLRPVLQGTSTAFAAKFISPNIPVGGFNPNFLSYGSVNIGTTSASKQSQFTNNGDTSLIINSTNGIVLGGANAGDFALVAPASSPQCVNGMTLAAAGGSCFVAATFKPTAAGNRSGTVTISFNSGGNSPQTLTLAGTGNGPAATLSTTLLKFLNQAPGVMSAVQTFTLKNTGNASLTSITMTKSGTNSAEFTATTSPTPNCGGTLAAGATCTISVTFKPTTTGVRVAVLTFAASGVPSQNVNLLGNPPIASVNPSNLNFATVNEGVVAPFQTVTLSNTALFTSMTFLGAVVADAVNYQAASNCPPQHASELQLQHHRRL